MSYTGWNNKKTTWFHFRLMKTGFLFFVADHLLDGQLCTNPKSDRSLLERDRRCAAVQLMRSTDPTYDNRTIASTLKVQIWIATNKRDVPRVMKTKFLATVMVFAVVSSEGHLTSLKSAWKSTPKCTWMCWRVRWSPGATRWPVPDPGYGSRTRRQPTSPKRPRLGFRRSATTLYPSLTGPAPPLTWTRWTTSFGHTSRTSPTWLPTTPKPAWSPPPAKFPPALVEKACSQFRIRIEAVIEAEGGYIE